MGERQCVECKFWDGEHGALCEQQPVEDQLRKLRAAYKSLYDAHAFNRKSLRRWKEIAVFWQGKFNILRHENNQLRKKWRHLNAMSDPETLEAHKRIMNWLGCEACKASAKAEIKATVEGKRIVTE